MSEPDPDPLPDPAAWVTRDQVRDQWSDAPMNDETLNMLIEAAHHQVLAFAPALTDPEVVPSAYRLAEIYQVKSLGSVQDDGSDVAGFSPEGFAVRRRPLSSDAKALLRPKSAVPVVG